MSIWKKLYLAWENKNCEEFNKYRSQLTDEDKNSPYFSYYESLRVKLCKDSTKNKKLLLKWKTIKCSSCWAPLTLSEYNKLQLEKLTSTNDQVEFICEYCWNKFYYSRKPFRTLFSWYKVWQKIKIKWQEYTLAGAIKYKWTYKESDGSWKLEYIEWIGYDKNWNIVYISESLAWDSEWVYKSLEYSKKVNFPFVIKSISSNNIDTTFWKKQVKELDEVNVVSIVWNVNKKYKIWEKVKLWKFDNYYLEEESWENHIERNLYEDINNPFTSILSNNPYWIAFDSALIIIFLLTVIYSPLLAQIIWLFILFFFMANESKKHSLEVFLIIIIFIIIITGVSLYNSPSWTYYSSRWSSSYWWGK